MKILSYIMIVVVLLSGIRMFVIPYLRDSFKRIGELKKQISEESGKSNEKVNEIENDEHFYFGEPKVVSLLKYQNEKLVEDILNRQRPKLTKSICEICEKPLQDEKEIKSGFCTDCGETFEFKE